MSSLCNIKKGDDKILYWGKVAQWVQAFCLKWKVFGSKHNGDLASSWDPTKHGKDTDVSFMSKLCGVKIENKK